ncbi:MAG: dephospho-CoA kinase [Steroidobacteraceae bacterium]
MPRPPSTPLLVGLTGGIASGKSTVAALFHARGVPVIDLDEVARAVVAPGTALLAQVLAQFRAEAQRAELTLELPEGGLNRRALRALVFSDPAARARLEALLHPAIRLRTDAQLAMLSAVAYAIVVNPLLVEHDARDRYDRVLLVDAGVHLQRQRLAMRDGSDAGEIEAMLAAQTSRAARLAVADDVIVNDADPQALEQRVAQLHAHYLALAHAR